MMSLKNLPDDIKIRAFNLIVEKFVKDSTVKEFGDDVLKVLVNLKELYKN